jgi:DNA invertase Pin-like site-specific DNA recombinase
MNKLNNNRRLNCAIYTRKSTDEGLDKEFNSLDAQRECAEAYIKSQTQEGWNCLPDHYDDGGFTGGNMDRPALSATPKRSHLRKAWAHFEHGRCRVARHV